jgi:hypothetical protein
VAARTLLEAIRSEAGAPRRVSGGADHGGLDRLYPGGMAWMRSWPVIAVRRALYRRRAAALLRRLDVAG